MSLFNAVVAPDGQSAVALADSLVPFPGGNRMLCKLFDVPHMDAVFGGRGVLGMTLAAVHAAHWFDSLSGDFAEALNQQWRNVNAVAEQPMPVEQEVAAVAWSRIDGRFRILGWQQRDANEGFVFVPGDGMVWLAPCDDEIREAALAKLESSKPVADRLHTIAELQIARFGREVMGGDLYLAELEPGRVSISREEQD